MELEGKFVSVFDAKFSSDVVRNLAHGFLLINQKRLNFLVREFNLDLALFAAGRIA